MKKTLQTSNRKRTVLIFFQMFLSLCCAFSMTSASAQGKLVAKPKGSTSAQWGYYEYLPSNYKAKKEHPVIIFLHGSGENGNGTSSLTKVLKHGPPKLINQGKWPSSSPFIIIAPQSPNNFYNAKSLNEFINFLIKNYRIDENRIYLTGLSAGGISTWNYLASYPNVIAAAIPISGEGRGAVNKAGCSFKHVPIWAFHGSKDHTLSVNGSIRAVQALNACSPKPNPLAKVSVYQGVGHDAWTRTYNLTGMGKTDGKYDPFNKSIYDWLLSYSKKGAKKSPGNQSPVAKAGNDIVLQPKSNVTLNGKNSYDPDGKIISYAWKKKSGPGAVLAGISTSQLSVKNLKVGVYKFELRVKDNDGASDVDEVLVTVKKEQTSSSDQGLVYKYYEGTWNKLPDFSKLKPVKTGSVANFNLSPRRRNENFSFRFDGYVEITKPGKYTFYTSSDDGSKLYIDDKEVVNNDGLHPNKETSGKINLSKGYHKIQVRFFERRGEQILTVKYAGPGISKRSIPNARLYPSKPSSDDNKTPTNSGENMVVKFYIVNPDNNKRIGELTTGSKITVGNGFNIEAVTNPAKVGSVKFSLNNTSNFSTENVTPYALGGDSKGNFNSLILNPGSYTLKATAYSKSSASGEAGETRQVTFKIIKGKNIGINARLANNATSKQTVNTLAENLRKRTFEIGGVYPNPVEDQLHIRFTGEYHPDEVSYELFNYVGDRYLLEVTPIQIQEGGIAFDVAGLDLGPGIYFLRINYNGGNESKIYRLIKH